jgi:hypothetical protein
MGQKLHLQGLVDAIRAGGKTAWAIHAHHKTLKGEPIVAKDAIVFSVYDGNSWVREVTEKTLHELMESLYCSHLLEYPRRVQK